MKRGFTKDSTVVGNAWVHYIVFIIYMFLFWLLVCNIYHTKFLIMGAIASVAVAYVCMPFFMIKNRDHSKQYFILGFNPVKMIYYGLWLFKELVLANIDVIKTTWKPSKPVDIQIIRFRADYANPIPLALLANSITLTPGTITVDVDMDDIYTIHALTPGAAQGILDGTMAKKIAWLYKEEIDFEVIDVRRAD